MLQNEFQDRVQMVVSSAEYSHIEFVYMHSDLDKDEFCKLWVKMNQGRVNKYKAEMKAKAELEAKKDKLWDILSRYKDKWWTWLVGHKIDKVLGKRELKAIEDAGIELKCFNYSAFEHEYKNMHDILYDIRDFLKA